MKYQNSTYKRPLKLVNGSSVDNLFSFWASFQKKVARHLSCFVNRWEESSEKKRKNELRRKAFWKLLFCWRWKVGNAVIGSKTCFHQQPKIKWKVAFMKNLRNIFQAKRKCANIGLNGVTFSRNPLCCTFDSRYNKIDCVPYVINIHCILQLCQI